MSLDAILLPVKGHRGRRAFSLVEVLVAGIILTAALIPIITNFQTLFRGYKKTHQATHAMSIAQCVLETIRHRFYDWDTRFFLLNDRLDERQQKLGRKEYEGVFKKVVLDFEEFRSSATGPLGFRVTQVAGQADTLKYFKEFFNFKDGGAKGITETTNPVLFRQLSTYRATVRVVPGTPRSFLDSEPNGSPEIDMCEVQVEVAWLDVADKRQSLSLSNVLTRRQYNPFPDGK